MLYALIGIMGAAAYERAEVRLPSASLNPHARLRLCAWRCMTPQAGGASGLGASCLADIVCAACSTRVLLI